jgi:aldose 1-epimerase
VGTNSIELRSGGFDARISPEGGLLTKLHWTGPDGAVPLLRDAPEDADALLSSCYPLVPFGNRVRGNRFRFGGREHAFSPNTDWDPHYLHGEGWQGRWNVAEADGDHVRLTFSFPGGEGTPYAYDAEQVFAVSEGAFVLRLSVTHRGEEPLPYGLGWHPYVAMTPQTTLEAPASRFWTEVEGWLPGTRAPIPEDLDFSTPRRLPERWVNNGFEDWSGRAVIRWPERASQLTLDADPVFRHAFVFVSDTAFDPSYARDYFCFEPMTHLADGHNMQDLGGLAVLGQGETLSGSIRLRPAAIG